VENDLRVMKIKRWRKKAKNREEWASVIKEAKVLRGALSQGASKQTRGQRRSDLWTYISCKLSYMHLHFKTLN
jgi:hypothetical protein